MFRSINFFFQVEGLLKIYKATLENADAVIFYFSLALYTELISYDIQQKPLQVH